LAAVAGCTGGSPVSGPAGTAATPAQAQTERAAVLPVAKNVYGQLTGAGVGWSAVIAGGYEACGTDDPLATSSGNGVLQYTATELMTPYSHAVSLATFTRQVRETLTAAGLALSAHTSTAGVSYYTARDGSMDVRLDPYGQQSLGPTVTIDVSGQCFDAGSAALHMMQDSPVDQVHEPRPSATPTPKYS
jgi:hypothetical protein